MKLFINNIAKSSFTSSNSANWLKRHLNDDFVKKSKLLQYRSRAAFKILEIQDKYKIFRPGQFILDFGAAPGGWSQVISNIIKSNLQKPSIVAVDILPFDKLDGVKIIKGDITNRKTQEEIFRESDFNKFDIICSDACPEFIGIKDSDIARAIDLNKVVINYAFKYLKQDGHLIIKAFEGKGSNEIQEILKKQFMKVNKFKPSSSRSESAENYLICLFYKQISQEDKEENILKSSNIEMNKIEQNAKLDLLNKKFDKMIGKTPDNYSKEDEIENAKHKSQIIKNKIDEIDFQFTQMDEISKAIEIENKLSLLREDDFKENKRLKDFKTWKDTSVMEEAKIKENLNTNILDSTHEDDYQKNMDKKFESDMKKQDKVVSNKKFRKEKKE